VTESDYITSLRSRFYGRHPYAFFYKIPDSHDGGQRPFDGFWILKGTGFVAFEAKMHKSLSPWHFNKIEPHQIANLRAVKSLGMNALVVLAVRCLTKKFDRARMPKQVTRVSMDIFIPADMIPGSMDEIHIDKLDVRALASNIDLKGNRINEVYLSKDRFAEFTS
jgi:hypothetical protein